MNQSGNLARKVLISDYGITPSTDAIDALEEGRLRSLARFREILPEEDRTLYPFFADSTKTCPDRQEDEA
jgi:hypothetical protein